MSGLSKLFNRPRKSQSTPTKSFGCLPAKLTSSIPINKRHSSPPPTTVPYQQQQRQQYVMSDFDFVPRPVQENITISTSNTETIKPIKKKKNYNAPLTVRNPTPEDYFYMTHSLADTPSREQVTRYTLVDNKPSAPMRKPTPFAHTKPNKSSNVYTSQSTAEEEEKMMVNQELSDYNRENKQQKHGKMFSTKSELEKMKQQLENMQKERAEFKQQEKRHKRREKRMHQQILETREQLDSLMLSRSYEERTTPHEYAERPVLTKRNSVGSTNYFQQQHPHYHYQYWYNEPSYHHHHHPHPHSYTSPSSAGYFPATGLYQRYGSSLDNIYLVDHENLPLHYSQNNGWSQQQQQQQQQHQRSSYQAPSYFYDEPERLSKEEIRRKASYNRHHPITKWSF